MPDAIEQATATLEAILLRMTTVNEELLTLLGRKRDAMRRGDADAMAQLCALENQKVQAISGLEKQRLELVAKLTLLLDPRAAEPLRMADLADRLPEPARGRVLMLRVQLRDKLTQVREQTSIARRAADALVRHVAGVVQGVVAVANGTAAYARPGVAVRPAGPVSTFRMTA
jgi:hypothetical protein